MRIVGKLGAKETRSSFYSNELVQYLKKNPDDFTREDIVGFVSGNGIRMLNFNYAGGDGRLKTLSFAIRNENHLRRLLDQGERVDGSSLFKYIDTGSSDLYVIPRFRTAFVNPFTVLPTLNLLCSYFDGKGDAPDIAPEHIVRKAHDDLKSRTGMELHALGELEYYIYLKPGQQEIFPSTPQRNYHEGEPFAKCKAVNEEALHTLAAAGIKAKYGHSEVGAIPMDDGTRTEQYEIELDLEPLEDAADHLVLAKWILRNTAAKHGLEVTFAPKLAVGHAGSGMHVHMAAMKNGRNLFLDRKEDLSETARKIIGGLLKLAPSLTAFGNTNPSSYLRLVPRQEAPTNVCWGEKNRSVLIRVPLGWRNVGNLSAKANKAAKNPVPHEGRQTVELRSPDGSANVHLLLAGIGVAARYGLTSGDSLKLTEDCYVNVNIFKEEHKHIQERLVQLPASCHESAERLREHASIYEEGGVFDRRVIEWTMEQLKGFNDRELSAEMKKNRKKAEAYIRQFMHCG